MTVFEPIFIGTEFNPANTATVYKGGCLDLLASVPDESMQLVVTSPPYNIGKEYEKRLHINEYFEQQREVIHECIRVLRPDGHLCWQVGNYVDKGSILPLDMILYPIFRDAGLKMRNRIIWHFEHGLHCRRRFSGRYETILWFTKEDNYYFDLDPVRVQQKYPGKRHFKGPRAGQYSCNPLGKNPGDVWIIPNVKSNHVEKTIHPCQFPVELIERLVLSLTRPHDSVFDPFLGVGTTILAAVKHDRKGHGSEVVSEYVKIAKERIQKLADGRLRTRPMNTPVFDPKGAGQKLTNAPWLREEVSIEPRLF
ncbi:MAG: site-specific DNA-methyltransferase [Sedimentisphaerales bacterium]|nr:site-specific DNA-methyltransferase [Sedimentisphaerales bacterium]